MLKYKYNVELISINNVAFHEQEKRKNGLLEVNFPKCMSNSQMAVIMCYNFTGLEKCHSSKNCSGPNICIDLNFI